MSILDMGAKECTACGDVKALTEFTRDTRRIDGRGSKCRACDRDRAADYDAGIRHAEQRQDPNRTGRFLCTCPVAYPAPKHCRTCGRLVVAAMHPDAQAHAARRLPWVLNQVVMPHERKAVAS